jgi:N-methylhydantoinase B
MSSGGGYGDPLDREAERILTDIENGIVSPREAREIYGVVVTRDVLDAAATSELRARLRRERLGETP